MIKRSSLTGGGFTIIEVMIVLVVTGALFVSAATLLSGRQQRTEFTTSLNDFRSEIDSIINGVGSGFVPRTDNMDCRYIAPHVEITNAAGKKAGTNDQCIFAGKGVQFLPPGANGRSIKIFTVVARRLSDTGNILTITDSSGAAVVDAAAGHSAATLTDSYTLLWDVQVTKVVDNTGPTAINTKAVAFFNSVGELGADGSPVSGSQNEGAAVLDMAPTNNPLGLQLALDSATWPPSWPANGVTICLSRGNNENGHLSIGTNHNQLSTLVFNDGKTPAPGC